MPQIYNTQEVNPILVLSEVAQQYAIANTGLPLSKKCIHAIFESCYQSYFTSIGKNEMTRIGNDVDAYQTDGGLPFYVLRVHHIQYGKENFVAG